MRASPFSSIKKLPQFSEGMSFHHGRFLPFWNILAEFFGLQIHYKNWGRVLQSKQGFADTWPPLSGLVACSPMASPLRVSHGLYQELELANPCQLYSGLGCFYVCKQLENFKFKDYRAPELLLGCPFAFIQSGFSFSTLWSRQTGDHPQEDAAIFGYRSGRKVENLRNPARIWQHIWSRSDHFRLFSLKI